MEGFVEQHEETIQQAVLGSNLKLSECPLDPQIPRGRRELSERTLEPRVTCWFDTAFKAPDPCMSMAARD